MIEKLSELIAMLENSTNAKLVKFDFESKNLKYDYKFTIEKQVKENEKN